MQKVSQHAIPLSIEIGIADISNKRNLIGNPIAWDYLHLEVSPYDFRIEQEKDFSIQLKTDFECNSVFAYCNFSESRLPNEIKLSFQVFTL